MSMHASARYWYVGKFVDYHDFYCLKTDTRHRELTFRIVLPLRQYPLWLTIPLSRRCVCRK